MTNDIVCVEAHYLKTLTAEEKRIVQGLVLVVSWVNLYKNSLQCNIHLYKPKPSLPLLYSTFETIGGGSVNETKDTQWNLGRLTRQHSPGQ